MFCLEASASNSRAYVSCFGLGFGELITGLGGRGGGGWRNDSRPCAGWVGGKAWDGLYGEGSGSEVLKRGSGTGLKTGSIGDIVELYEGGAPMPSNKELELNGEGCICRG